MDCPITRRDFLNGVAIGVGGVDRRRPCSRIACGSNAHARRPGRARILPANSYRDARKPSWSFETAHSERDSKFWDKAGKPTETGEAYDLVVVGGGISGLAAAYFYRKHAGPAARILILDNHDDFGGHAKRNEFRPGGRLLLTNGGTVAIESPFPYSKEARGLLTELGIDPPAMEKKYMRPRSLSRSGIRLLLRQRDLCNRAIGDCRSWFLLRAVSRFR